MKTAVLAALLTITTVFPAWAGMRYQVTAEEKFVMLEDSEGLRAVIAPGEGGELAAFSVRIDGKWHELLYRALDYSYWPGWRGKAPLLWPATGISILGDGRKHQYRLGDRIYEMPFHGFARSQRWEIAGQRQSAEMASVTLKLADNDGTRRLYPFSFELQVEYRLHGNGLSLVYRVAADAANDGPMPFSIGNHITFNAPLVAGADASDLQFESELPVRLVTGEDKAFAGKIVPSAYRGRLNLTDLPRRESLSLGGGPDSPEVTIYDPSGLELRIRHHGPDTPAQPFVQFNLWADAEEGFFSPEPWAGSQNSLNTGMGLIYLEPGRDWHWQIDIIPRPNGSPDTVLFGEIK